MKYSAIKTVYDFMRYCHMPLWCQREIRDMKVGDTYFFGQYKENLPDEEGGFFIAEAWIEKERGVYQFYGTWTFPTKPSRALIMTYGDFKIGKGGVIQFSNDGEGIQSFALVSRYLDQLVRKMTTDDRHRYFSAGSKPLYRGVWVDKNYIDRKEHGRYECGSLQRYRVDYSNHAPTQQLAAVIIAGLALNQLSPDSETEY